MARFLGFSFLLLGTIGVIFPVAVIDKQEFPDLIVPGNGMVIFGLAAAIFGCWLLQKANNEKRRKR